MNFERAPEEILRAAGGSREQFDPEPGFAPGWDRNPDGDFADRRRRGQREADAPETLAIIDPAALQALPVPERRWIVHDWLGCGHTTALYGNGGVGKTLLAQMLMTATALGRPWLGQITRPCRSLALLCEDDLDELHRRQERINQAVGCDFSDLGAIRWLNGAGSDNVFAGFDSRGNMQVFPRFYEIQRAAKAHGAELIVLDGAADLFAGNENDRGNTKRFINLLTGLARDQGAAVLLLAHPSRNGLASGALDSGSTGWNNSVRARWTLAPEPAEEGAPSNGLILTRAKSNYAPGDPTIRLQWGRGVPIAADQAAAPSGARADAEAVFLALLGRCTASGIAVSESLHGGNFAPKIFAKRPDREGHTRKDFERAMHALFALGTIEMRDWKDANGRPRRSIFVSKPEKEGQE